MKKKPIKKKTSPASKSKTVVQKKSKEVAEGTYVIDLAREEIKQKEISILYTIFGSHDKLIDGGPVILDNKKIELIYAKSEIRNNKIIYSIKTDEYGALYNPISVGGVTSFKSKLLGDQVNKFVKVSKECFLQYLEFLKTKNILHYKFADRNKQ